jgi:hypothetical protein
MKTLLASVLGLALAFTACHHSSSSNASVEKSSTPEASAREAATISARPNPVLHGPQNGTTMISWDSQGPEAEVYVRHDNEPEQLFAKGSKGSESVNWIQTGTKYEFLLYKTSSHEVLAKVEVTHQP